LDFAGQTFEGGISAKPDVEAHGAYAFCALACLCVLGDPHVMIPKYAPIPHRGVELLTRGCTDTSMFPAWSLGSRPANTLLKVALQVARTSSSMVAIAIGLEDAGRLFKHALMVHLH
jgi:hypothetical protein